MANTSSKRPGAGLLVLVAGFAISVLLVVLGSVVSTLEVSRAREEVTRVFAEGERTTYLLGHLGKQILRSHMILREAVTTDEKPFETATADVLEIHSTISVGARELVELLSPTELEDWKAIDPVLTEVMALQERAATLLAAGEASEASELLETTMPRIVWVSDRMTALAQRNRAEIDSVLQDVEERLTLVRGTLLALGTVLLVGVALSWTFAIQTIRRQRRELEEFVLRVETANRDLDAFAGRIAHDLRNAFSPISMAASMLKRAAERPEAVETISTQLERSTSRAMTLLEGLLAFSRAGRPSDSTAVSSLREAVDSTTEDMRPLAENVDATIEVDVPEDIHLRISPGLVHVILGNLVSNALKFIAGRPRREVRIEARLRGRDHCSVVVEDTGPGIPREALTRIFDPFYRVEGSSAPGTGIGLTTTRRIVEAHGGRIEVSSVPGTGSRFEVILPLAQEDETPPSASSDEDPED
ncbi:MAG TPA: HAMP domain-containing sensor histidine kinase [Planctomycetota bacterium]|nr:HAMP domain-containing sensor histidine kinase [Planctomycetota bacterium]